MDWDWVKGYPIFVYTVFLDNKEFNVKLVKGVKGNQNAGDRGPNAPAWHEYVQKGLASKNEVVRQALKIAKRLIEEKEITMQETKGNITAVWIDEAELMERKARAWEYIMRKQRERSARSSRIFRKALVVSMGTLMLGCLIAAIMLSLRG